MKLPRSKAQPLTLQRKALSSLHRLLELEIAPAQSKQFLSELCPAGMSAPLRAVVPAATMRVPAVPAPRGAPHRQARLFDPDRGDPGGDLLGLAS